MLSFSESYVGRLREKVGNMRVILPGSTVIIENSNGEILITKNKGSSEIRFVGGLAEDNESLYQCAVRECKEETGLDIKDLIPVGYFDNPKHIMTLENGHECFFHSMLFYCKDYSGEINISENEDDVEKVEWLDLNNKENGFDDEAHMFLKAYRKFKKTGQFELVTSK